MTDNKSIAKKLHSDLGSLFVTQNVSFTVGHFELVAKARFQIYTDGSFDINDWSIPAESPVLNNYTESDIDSAFYQAVESESVKAWAYGMNQQRINNYIEELKSYAEDLGKADIMTLAERNR